MEDLVLSHLGTKGGRQSVDWLFIPTGVTGLHGSLLLSVHKTWRVTGGGALCLPLWLVAGRLVPASPGVAWPHTCPSLDSVRAGRLLSWERQGCKDAVRGRTAWRAAGKAL